MLISEKFQGSVVDAVAGKVEKAELDVKGNLGSGYADCPNTSGAPC